jgi:hypothetical protein
MSNLKKLAKEGGNKAVVGGNAVETPDKKLTEGSAGVLDGLAVGGGGAEGAGEEGGESAAAEGGQGGEKEEVGGVDEAAS